MQSLSQKEAIRRLLSSTPSLRCGCWTWTLEQDNSLIVKAFLPVILVYLTGTLGLLSISMISFGYELESCV